MMDAMREGGRPSSPSTCGCVSDGVNAAALAGATDVVKLLLTSYNVKSLRKDTVTQAATRGHVGLIKFLYTYSSVHYVDIRNCYLAAAEHGRVDVIQFLFVTSCRVPINEMYIVAARANHLATIKFLDANLHWRPTDTQALDVARRMGESHRAVADYLSKIR
eukprot:TRINITY_DN14551_c0_g1_i1.p1 TRINITY_DN14551_c0_g1~~TRINITY_DN14551_c0_g1_i1.p1  ORF type:complete len:190 (+),score=31.23 TRINITY_DN14551_c0_g1_i1:86-571(+)